MKAAKLFKELAKGTSVGPSPSFTEFDLAKTLEMVGKEKSIGRTRLSRELELGQGATRTILDHLERAGLIRVERSGCTLTSEGLKILKELGLIVKLGFEVPSTVFAVAPYGSGALVSKAAHKVKRGLEQRDAAIRVGASCAVTLVYRDGKVLFPLGEEVESEDWPKVSNRIIEIFQPAEGDVIIIARGASPRLAETGARAAAWTLLESN